MKKIFYLLILSIFSSMFVSCQKEDEGNNNVRPEDVVDPDHVKVNDKYGISVICPVDTWTNNYLDATVLGDSASVVTLALRKDSIVNAETGKVSYPTSIYLLRFLYQPTSEEDAVDFIVQYRKKVFENLLTVDYSSVPEYTGTMVNGYPCYYLQATLGGSRSTHTGKRDLYMFYNNGVIYGAMVSVLDDLSSANAYEECTDIIKTIKLK